MYFQAFLMLYGPVEGCAGRGVLAGARGGRAGAVAAPRPPGGRRYWWRVPCCKIQGCIVCGKRWRACKRHAQPPPAHRRHTTTQPGVGSRELGVGSRELGAGSREREPGAGSGSREPGAGSREPDLGLNQTRGDVGEAEADAEAWTH